VTLEQQSKMLAAQRETAKTNVDLAETALAAAEREFKRIDDEMDRISELQWQETERRLRRFA
jgi:hypothetical protein